MKIQIDNKRYERDSFQKGFFRKPQKIVEYQVRCSIEFSEEERAILTTYGLWDTVVYTDYMTFDADMKAANPGLEYAEGDVPWSIKAFAEGLGKQFTNPSEANAFVEQLKSQILPGVKKCIDDAKRTGQGASTTFEL
jgi:hypothetical protein